LAWLDQAFVIAEMLMMFYVMPLAADIMAFAANNSVLPLDWSASLVVVPARPQARQQHAKMECHASWRLAL
jgi:hypothetical protein